MKNRYISLIYGLVILCVVSCSDSLDINESPNNPANSTPELTLPAAMLYSGQSIGIDFALLSGFMAQYWTQSPTASQYSAFDRYNYTGTATSDGWTNSWYGALSDLKFVREAGIEDNLNNHAAIATLLMAYQYQVLVDMFDQVPFDEALLGEQTGNFEPVYQSGEEVYDKLIDLVDDGLNLIVPGGIAPSTEDLMLRGNMALWEKFGNTLKLRMYIRQSQVRPNVAQSGIQELINSGAEFLEAGEDVFISYPGSIGNQNPLYAGEISQQGLGNVNLTGSASIVTRFQDAGDPRVDYYFDPNTTDGIQLGLTQGLGSIPGGNLTRGQFSTPSLANVAAPTTPVYYITGFESLFLQAEAIERGWMSGDAQQVYNEAVQAAFTLAGGRDASSFTAEGGVYSYNGLESIHTQKWMAMAGIQNIEGWSEFRRTDTPSLEQSTQGTGASLNGSTFPRRAFYPIVEVSNNSNAPANTNIGDPVWWDLGE